MRADGAAATARRARGAGQPSRRNVWMARTDTQTCRNAQMHVQTQTCRNLWMAAQQGRISSSAGGLWSGKGYLPQHRPSRARKGERKRER